jgi:N,N'-diacetyllegionaminate synthase
MWVVPPRKKRGDMAKTIIIAEAGVNHNGSLKMAKQLVDVALAAGADYVKFQTFKAESLVSKNTALADYQKKAIGEQSNQYEMLKKLELSFDDFRELSRYCEAKGIKFLSTAFDYESLLFLNDLGMEIFKVPSGEITNKPYLKLMASFGKPIILSTGMANMQEVREALDVLEASGAKREKVTVLHCNSEYPTPLEDVNLRAMCTISRDLNVRVGYSDHTLGTLVAMAAVAAGASVIEKHFTLDKNLEGPDHMASIDGSELREMVEKIRKVEVILGSSEKKPSPSELKNIEAARKSIVALKMIHKGEIFTEQNITVKRPGAGISPMQWDTVLGKRAVRDFETDDFICLG